MPRQKRVKTEYKGVYYIEAISKITKKPERVYYIRYLKYNKYIEEKAGRQYQDNMTAAKASALRYAKISGDLSNQQKRDQNNDRVTFNYLWETYKIHRPDVKGIEFDENRFKNHIKKPFGNKEPKELTPLDIDKFRVMLMKKYQPATVARILEILRRLVNFGVSRQLCKDIDFKIELPRINNNKTEDLSPEQLKKLMVVLEEDSDIHGANFMKMALFTGMRRGELLRLKWDHIDFNRGFITIVDPKGGKDQRIPLNSAVHEMLMHHPRFESEYVFPGRDGGQRVDIKRTINRIKKKAELPKDFRPLHGLRHVYASMLASSGKVDMYTLQKLLTHKSPQMTQRYAHLRDDALKNASNLASEIINSLSHKPE